MAVIAVMVLCVLVSCAFAQGPRRDRDNGMAAVVSSNTTGAGNSWVTLQGIGFVWADTNNIAKPFIFGEVHSETGITNFASLIVNSRIMSYTWARWPQFGNVVIGAKLTFPDNRELRFRGYGLELKYIYNTTPNFASLAGYRVGGTGFNAEGYTVQGSNFQFKVIHDMDFISKISRLPLKIGINAGMRIPLEKEPDDNLHYIFNQYLLSAGVMWTDLGFDIFAEYSLEAFNNLLRPVKIIGLGSTKKGGQPSVMEVAFLENPMYVTLGGRIRYNNGVTLSASLPFLVSKNVGSSMTRADNSKWNTDPNAFLDEKARGINSAFDPWFAKWKIVGELSFPFLYKQTGSEMMRNFLLMKNSGRTKKIDIDEQLKTTGGAASDTTAPSEQDNKKRLEDIKKRREEIQKPE